MGNPRASIIANSLEWSMEPKAFLKSKYNRYISVSEYLASSSAAITV